MKKKAQNKIKGKTEIEEPKEYKVTDNCTVSLKSIDGKGYKKVRISTVNGFDKYVFLIGKSKGVKVRVDGEYWIISYISKDKRKKYFRRKSSLMSHPLNNTTHFFRWK